MEKVGPTPQFPHFQAAGAISPQLLVVSFFSLLSMRHFSLLFLFVLAVGVAHGQPQLTVPSEPPEWGEVSPEVLRVTEYPADSNASAVVLSHYGRGYFKVNGEIEVEYHKRVKILKSDGYDSGTVTIPYLGRDRLQQVNDVEGVTYTLDDDGQVETHELDDDDIFEEDVDGDVEQVRFTLPNLEPGAVIEYRYELDSKSWRHIPSWSFQEGEPTLYSEYHVRIPAFLEYATLTTGAQNYDTVDEKKRTMARGTELEKRWVMTEVPALREEPFITTLEDYRSRVQLQIKLLRNPRSGVIEERFMNSWPALAEQLLDAGYFGKNLGDGGGGLFGGDGAVETQVQQVTEGVRSDSAKTHEIYEYVRSTVEWNGETTRFREQDFDDILESKTGNAADVNLLLVSMLQNAGIEAHPVLISTRDHGKVFPIYPFESQFNSVIASVDLPDREDRVLLDATEPLCPVSLLPKRDLNRKGWLVRKEEPVWIDIPAPNRTRRRVFVNGKLRDDGTLVGTLNVQDYGFTALESRRTLQDTDDEGFVRERLLERLTDISLSEVSVKNVDAVESPLVTSAKIEVPGYAQAAGGNLYVNPRLLPSHTKNPLERKDRTYPVDFGHPRKTTYVLSLQLPDGYEVSDMPTPQKVTLPNEEGQFSRLIQTNRGQVTVRSVMEIREPRVPPRAYKALRELFARAVSAQSEQLVLEKAATKEASSASSVEGN